MAQVICVNCFLEYPVGYCLLDLPEGCKKLESDSSSGNVGGELLEFDREAYEGNKDATLNDPISTGRKRAARLFPIAPGQVCEWAWHKHCGGGVEPIVGCTGRPATNIHHGPDKSTLNNDRATNISIICEFCHNRWHGANDKYYVEPRPKDNLLWLPGKGISEDRQIFLLSDIVKAEKQEILLNEMMIPEGGKDRKRV